MKPKDAQKLAYLLLAVGFFITLAGYIAEWLGMVGIIIMVSALIPHYAFYRCPHCGRHLGRNDGDFCQFCGKRIDE